MILDILAEATRQRVEKQKKEKDPFTLRREAEALPRERSGCFRKVLENPGLNFITEVKKASPSKGLIAPDFPYMAIARQYEALGAAAISVLTETDYFLGSDRYLREIRQAVATPLLRKDFTIDEYMVYQARTLGADAILLIAAILSDSQLEEYRLLAESLGMDALVEAHDEEEVERVLRSGARVIGVNNRNLKDFTVDIGNSLRLRSLVPADIPFVAESGIRSRQQTAALEQAGVNGVLIGETLMRSSDMKAALAELRGEIL
ncbi:indole-3-glycerol phosphate synthase TrpC [Acidaminococcus fermentans]|uniref:indole-3-glycerol phosphate synthase TrpC n=1 Tax=Acidaminococcus fermentans TaxID=905 RepID=UPI00242E597A|nr:indole-3-glycerol phosphate synthase TrpC [Acidaminococcus fermentans]